MGLLLTLLSLLQDVVFSRLRISGATFDLVPCGILLGCILMLPDWLTTFIMKRFPQYDRFWKPELQHDAEPEANAEKDEPAA